MLHGQLVVEQLAQLGYDETVEYLMNDRGKVDRAKYIELLKTLGESRG